MKKIEQETSSQNTKLREVALGECVILARIIAILLLGRILSSRSAVKLEVMVVHNRNSNRYFPVRVITRTIFSRILIPPGKPCAFVDGSPPLYKCLAKRRPLSASASRAIVSERAFELEIRKRKEKNLKKSPKILFTRRIGYCLGGWFTIF